MRSKVLLIIFLIFSNSVFGQSETNSVKKFQETYLTTLDFLIDKKANLINESIISKKDLNNIIILKKNKYNLISDLEDSLEKKRLLQEEIKDLQSFTENYSDKNFTKAYLESNLQDVEIYSQRVDSLKSINGLESCAKCAIARKVKFVILKVENNKIDTVKCATLKYIKTGFQKRKLIDVNFDSFPCTKVKVLSLSGYYGTSIIEISIDEKKYRREFTINMGKSENDIYTLSIKLDKKYLVYD